MLADRRPMKALPPGSGGRMRVGAVLACQCAPNGGNVLFPINGSLLHDTRRFFLAWWKTLTLAVLISSVSMMS